MGHAMVYMHIGVHIETDVHVNMVYIYIYMLWYTMYFVIMCTFAWTYGFMCVYIDVHTYIYI